MSEQNIAIGEHIDVTAQTLVALHTLASQDTQTLARPRNLDMIAPGVTAKITNERYRMMNDRRGISSDQILGDEPVRVTHISVNRWGGFGVTLADERRCSLDGSAIDGVRFIQAPGREDAQTLAFVDETAKILLNSPYEQVAAADLSCVLGNDFTVGVRAKEPLLHPVMFRSYDGEMGSEPIGAVDGDFLTVTSYRDKDGAQLARVNFANPRKSTDWLPIDTLEFYPIAKERQLIGPEALLQRAAYILMKNQATLGSFNTAVRAINDRNTVDTPSQVWRNLKVDRLGRRVADVSHLPLVFGKLAAAGSVELASIFTPRLHEQEYGDPYLRVDRAIIHDNHPWVVDDKTHLAVPLEQVSSLVISSIKTTLFFFRNVGESYKQSF